MAYQNDPNAGNKEEQIKSCFITREGTYKLMTLSEYSRPNRVPLNPQGANNMAAAPVRVSFLTVPAENMNASQSPEDVRLPGDAGEAEAKNNETRFTTGGANPSALGSRDYHGNRQMDSTYHPSTTRPIRDGQYPPRQNGFEDSDAETGYINSRDMDDPNAFFCPDRICFNVGRELYVYHYRGVRNAADLSKPIDKRVYKGTYPTYHHFNAETATADSCSLIIGFSAGQIQLIDPFRKECQMSKLFNEDRLIDKTRVTCLKWVPGSPKQFLAAHASGQMYLYNEDLGCGQGAPAYQQFKSGAGYVVYTCKTRSSRNPVYRWQIGDGPINEFCFSPDQKLLAIVSQDGFMRIFNYHSMELVGQMRSYFGGLLTLSWSPDGKYMVTGGEDDLITVYSVLEKRIVCRGHGHKSWISQVAFDPYTTWLEGGVPAAAGVPIDLGSEEDLAPSSFTGATIVPIRGGLSRAAISNSSGSTIGMLRRGNKASVSSASLGSVCYRFGSVGHDTQLCLWDLTEDVLKMPAIRQRQSVIFPQSPPVVPSGTASTNNSSYNGSDGRPAHVGNSTTLDSNASGGGRGGLVDPLSTTLPPIAGTTSKKHKRGFSFGSKGERSSGNKSNKGGSDHNSHEKGDKDKENKGSDKDKAGGGAGKDDPAMKLYGTTVCPRLDEVPMIEPLICKKIAHERLTVLSFREDCIVTACQEGFICTWARPGKAGLSHQQSINSPNPGGSPNLLPGGTIV